MESSALCASLARRFSGHWSVHPLRMSGFCSTWRAESGERRVFVKGVCASEAHVLTAEADGLRALAGTRTIRVPAVLDCWLERDQDFALLVLEWLEFSGPDTGFGERFGRALASLHGATPGQSAGRFGWERENMLGGSRQSNGWSRAGGRSGWIEFFREQRLMPMRDAALGRHVSRELTEAVDTAAEHMPRLFDDGYVPRPSLIHGDLWSGNWGMLADGTPVIYDPAVSCSDAEAELAMMELFGSPPRDFWNAYRETAGIARGYEKRRPLYQLYHLLNHVSLFGPGYEPQALDRAKAVLRA